MILRDVGERERLRPERLLLDGVIDPWLVRACVCGLRLWMSVCLWMEWAWRVAGGFSTSLLFDCSSAVQREWPRTDPDHSTDDVIDECTGSSRQQRSVKLIRGVTKTEQNGLFWCAGNDSSQFPFIHETLQAVNWNHCSRVCVCVCVCEWLNL